MGHIFSGNASEHFLYFCNLDLLIICNVKIIIYYQVQQDWLYVFPLMSNSMQIKC
jgi:hypothetical protein